uniref:Uncharacterized protein n=2 Tax=Anguilla anguilla TaxID=7936 RepID=A0A0E9VEZ5_ANGAN
MSSSPQNTGMAAISSNGMILTWFYFHYESRNLVM